MESKTGTAAKQVKDTVENVSNSAEKLKEKVVQKVGETKEKVTDNLSTVADKFHEKSDVAQDFLETGVDNLNDFAHQAIGKVNQFGHKAADALSNSSEYLNNFDYKKTKQQVVGTIKEKPQVGFAIAGIFGLLIGLLIGRRNSK